MNRTHTWQRWWTRTSVAALFLTSPLTQAMDFSGEWRLTHQAVDASHAGPLAMAHALSDGLIGLPVGTTALEAELRAHWRFVQANVLLTSTTPQGLATQAHAQVQELFANAEAGDWQFSLGRKVVGWDVGYGFRPNDVVQQEARRTLLTVTPQGRPLLLAETFGSDTATSIVWVNPQSHHDAPPTTAGDEAALAARWYHRNGARDDHLFARWGRHTRASLGAAVAWVATDELELHASARWSQRHLAWQPLGSAPTENPWRMAVQGPATQWLLGAQWTGASQQGLMVEWWHDGSAMDDRGWDRWRQRNTALQQTAALPGLPDGARSGVAGQLAWQTTPLGGSSLRRNNVFVRASWQHEAWQLAWDTLYMPADHGQIGTVSAQWQADQWRLTLAWRRLGGPQQALTSALPSRHTWLFAAVWAF